MITSNVNKMITPESNKVKLISTAMHPFVRAGQVLYLHPSTAEIFLKKGYAITAESYNARPVEIDEVVKVAATNYVEVKVVKAKSEPKPETVVKTKVKAKKGKGKR
ncbi:MAG: hypothetical protein WC871_03645 [Bacteroidales bacterium]|jgi:hypothetical protein